ncbi:MULTISPECIES: hypothetical protein [Streptomyces]|uniref:hypothetical protein n=1 Tax=Streptomyces TaxID=1883 RepID=UPI000C621E77|nr:MULTISPECIES: hypothetical protein [Streptomyces]PIB04701.1 hypothetical protein B1C81_32505 [Streptomyces sp. HG99]
MLRIIDARTGEPTDAVRAPRSLVRVHARASGFDTTGLRVILVADVLVRALELGGTPVWATVSSRAGLAELRAGATALGVRPFEDHQPAATGPAEAQTIDVFGPRGEGTGDAGTGDVGTGGVCVEVAPVEPGSGPVDPGVLRLALLAHRRDEPLRLDAAVLADADGTLTRWRAAVAAWATRPSRPVPDDVRQRLRAAWEDDLDVPGVLRVLRWVETSDVPEGARFETYAYADRLLGLELTRDIGASL